MKKIAIAVILFTVSFQSFSQEGGRKSKREALEQLTPEQRNALHVKKMTLDLDLSPSQQKEVAALFQEEASKREAKRADMKANKEAKKELTPAEKFEMQNKMLDAQIEHKAKMKKILTKEQYEKWEKNFGKKQERLKKLRTKKRQSQHNEEIK